LLQISNNRTIFQIFRENFSNFGQIFVKIGKFQQSWHTYCMLRDKIKPFIPQIISRELTNRALAAKLGASETHICRLLKQLNVKRDAAPTRANKRALIQARQALRTVLANDPDLTMVEAARRANCSVRTLYRYRTKP